MKKQPWQRYIFLCAILLIIISFFIPLEWGEVLLGPGLRPIGLTTVFIAPLLGILGIVFSIFQKDWLFVFLNGCLLFSFFIVMEVAYFIIEISN